MRVTLTEMCAAIAHDLKMSQKVKRVMEPREMKESVEDLPLVQLYPQTIEGSGDSQTDRSTFRAGVRERQVVLQIDVFARPRSHIGEDMQATLEVADGVIDRLDQQQGAPYFGLAGFKSFKWSAERAPIVNNEITYMGMRFTLTLTLF